MPPGWRITGYGNGAVDVAGPQGQLVDVGIYLPIRVRPTFVGPVAGAIYLPFIADPVAEGGPDQVSPGALEPVQDDGLEAQPRPFAPAQLDSVAPTHPNRTQ